MAELKNELGLLQKNPNREKYPNINSFVKQLF